LRAPIRARLGCHGASIWRVLGVHVRNIIGPILILVSGLPVVITRGGHDFLVSRSRRTLWAPSQRRLFFIRESHWLAIASGCRSSSPRSASPSSAGLRDTLVKLRKDG
jgi:hypothetical protein